MCSCFARGDSQRSDATLFIRGVLVCKRQRVSLHRNPHLWSSVRCALVADIIHPGPGRECPPFRLGWFVGTSSTRGRCSFIISAERARCTKLACHGIFRVSWNWTLAFRTCPGTASQTKFFGGAAMAQSLTFVSPSVSTCVRVSSVS